MKNCALRSAKSWDEIKNGTLFEMLLITFMTMTVIHKNTLSTQQKKFIFKEFIQSLSDKK